MFSRFSRIPLRRCLHTGPARTASSSLFSRRAGAAVGASAVMAAYMTWQLTNESNRIALDAPQPSKGKPSSARWLYSYTHCNISVATSTTSLPKETRLAEPISGNDIALKPESTSVGDEFVPDSPEETVVTSPENESGDSEAGEEPSGEGKPSSGGAFNPETGEINWDCPCLGGMAHGPCGPEFREAFSCFVYSEAEPKGINCVEKFQNMQNCFRAHPEVYADGNCFITS